MERTDEMLRLSASINSKFPESMAVAEVNTKLDIQPDESVVLVIQTAIRKFLAKRELSKQKSIVKLQAAVRGHLVRRHAVGSLRCVQAIIKMQVLVRARRTRLSSVESTDEEKLHAELGRNNSTQKDHKCIMDIKEFLLEVCQENSIQQNMNSMLGEKAQDVGLLISQRVVNLPPQLLPPLYDALFDEVSWATEDEPTKELRSSFCFKYYLFVGKIYEHKKIKNKHDRTSSSSEEAIIYTKPEEEILHELCSWLFRFPLRTQQHTAHELKNYRIVGLVMAVEATKVSTFREQLRSLIDE